ncbi:transglycosylase [Salmonella enterica subsp. enterica serovar 4,[5],12:i:-]|uniref:Transglycosylase n=2 Tax=Salmonella enterica TaxID=28901 RepID=A0A0F7JH85_SALTM|nr:structural injection transglycosylase [Salmonella enterica]EAC1864558.1 transglycosylase [Salmonella enterica subsp. enterica serovar 4,[5],12:i:-]EBH3297804.1 transglycosylase [Salmonella enterica subsp. enterica serovar Javiana]ECI8016816.1 transglycosylase [Salmonella enterica subsp. enterica]ECU5964834.1 transglycosylase [Salmonella enterica subsp. enterica serovar Anatum]ECY3171169.1 transglycosylase [Salmonella enterica subsp. enterica serovar Agona]EDL7344138.1 transglycosylase [Sal
MDISPLATLNNYRNGEHSICQKPWKKNTKLKPGNVDRAGKREVILKENKDRIAIIDAIQEASTNELKALAEVKDAILSGASTITQQDERQGRVSNRLSRRRKEYEQSTSDSVRDVQTNPYKKRLPAKKERAPINQTVDRSIVATNTPESVRSVQSRQTIRKSDGFIPVAANSAPLEPQSPQSLKGPLRDSNGRFVSQKSNEDVARKKELQNARKADAKLQAGFLRKLGSIMGVDGNRSSSEESLTNAAGIGAGGPFWMAARGMYDITKEITGKAESLKEWVEKGKKETSTSKAISPVITYPAAVNSQKATSAKAFNNAVETKSAQAVEEQTKILQTNDNKIIDGLENVSDEIVKLRKSVSSGNKFGLSDLWKNRASRRNKINIGDQTGKNKRNKSKRKGRNLGKKALSAGEKVAAGSAAAGTGVGAAKVVKNKISKPKDVSTISDTSKGIAKETKNTAKAVKSAGVVAEDATIKTGEAIAKKKTESVALKSAAKIGVKSAASTAARAVPIIGSLAMAGYDAIDGYTDTEAQKAAFGLSDDDAVSEQQKTAYATANVLDMGGLVSGATNLIGKGISALGFERAGEKLQNFDTGDIARGVNGAVDITKSVFGSLKDTFLSTDENTKQVKKAVEDGTKKTVDAIHSLGEQLQGGRNGEDGVGEHGYTSPTEFSAPVNNTIAADLNIGGSNAKNRNYRNNNLGNLVFANQEGATLEAPNAKGEQRFARFNTPEEGIRALANQVSSYYNGTSAAAGYQKLQTVSSIISKWAPPKENNTNQYIDNVSKYLGVSPNEKIDVSNPEVMTQLVRAIATKEGGNPAVNNEFIKNALGAFNTNTGRWEGQFSDETLARINKIQKENGGQLIARDSQYSVGRKVKYANGKSPAQPVLNAVPTATQQPIEVAQHAQTVKKPQKTGNQSQPINPENVDVNTGSPSSLLERLIAINDSGVGNLFGGAATSLAGTSLGLIKDFASATSFGSISSLSEKAKGMDQALTEKISSLTGKSFGFQKASQVTDIRDALQKRPKAERDMPSVDLLSGVSSAGESEKISVNSRGIPVYDNGYKVIDGEDKGVLGSLFDSSLTGLKRISSAVLPAIGDNVSQLIGGVDGTGIVNDLVYQATGQNSTIARAISPLTRSAGSWLNNGIQQTADSIRGISNEANNAIFGSASAVQEPFLALPPQLPTVTDLARSGIRQPLTTDTINNDPAMLKALDNICSILNDLLNVNKNNTKGDPDKVVKTSQPQPRPRASTTINDPSLDALLED